LPVEEVTKQAAKAETENIEPVNEEESE